MTRCWPTGPMRKVHGEKVFFGNGSVRELSYLSAITGCTTCMGTHVKLTW